MAFNSPLRTAQVLVVGIVCALALTSGCSCFLGMRMDNRRGFVNEENRELTVETGSGEGQFHLFHWAHPQSPLYVAGLNLSQKVQLALENSKLRKAVLSNKIPRRRGVPPWSTTESKFPKSSFISPSSSILGAYSMELSIGTPVRTFTTIADTGSDLVWVQCSPCTDCFTEPYFNPANSSTYTQASCTSSLCQDVSSDRCNETCRFEYEYGDFSTTSGDFAFETVTLTSTSGNTTSVRNFGFGCGHDNEGNWPPEIEGLVGLGGGPLSFTSQLGGIFGHKFSYCLVSFHDSANQTSPLFFGDAAVPKVDTQYTPILTNRHIPTFYYMSLNGISVNGEALNIPPGTFELNNKTGEGGVIIDSGTTITYLTDAAYTPLYSLMKSLVKYTEVSGSDFGFDLCYDLSNVTNPVFPNVTMMFEGFSLDLPQQNSFLLVDGLQGTTCFSFAAGGGDLISIIGNVQQQNFQILYDLEAKRFGFAKVQCDQLTS